MLPRASSRVALDDLVIEVGDRGPGRSRVTWWIPTCAARDGVVAGGVPSQEALRAVLDKTYGVPLFEEQATPAASLSSAPAFARRGRPFAARDRDVPERSAPIPHVLGRNSSPA